MIWDGLKSSERNIKNHHDGKAEHNTDRRDIGFYLQIFLFLTLCLRNKFFDYNKNHGAGRESKSKRQDILERLYSKNAKYS